MGLKRVLAPSSQTMSLCLMGLIISMGVPVNLWLSETQELKNVRGWPDLLCIFLLLCKRAPYSHFSFMHWSPQLVVRNLCLSSTHAWSGTPPQLSCSISFLSSHPASNPPICVIWWLLPPVRFIQIRWFRVRLGWCRQASSQAVCQSVNFGPFLRQPTCGSKGNSCMLSCLTM